MSKIVATIDLGSNSFHMLISEIMSDGEVVTLSKQKQKVQLRAGLNNNLTISKDVQERAIQCLEFFAEEIENYNVEHVKAVGTYTLRKAKNKIKGFKRKLDKALGTKIKIISGPEEARLVYVGARDNHDIKKKTLVIDIGGGSTECVIGKGDKILVAKSLDMGCVGAQKECFIDEKLNFNNFHNAVSKAKKILDPIATKYKRISWNTVLGSSGTITSVTGICQEMTGSPIITKEFLNDLITKMMDKKFVEHIQFEGLREDRESVLAGGVAILYAVFESLGISQMSLSNGAVREGMLYELVKNKYKITIS
ncbi:Ppx/GppA phosphatase family protein [Francisella adeliensis]|uniref:Exopolyphosphatase n=1 Tax=Francisella adeliensis TaxID=2007306 RepID=A0A2Z4XY32_9GAMM|nr:Ppx/GppA phosphatase family protein [Francisella adeliensis]AXA33325.1 exopolyphosphatase [Francisella adeliensis]MBK2085335.1 Ppx/GppA family phosphatase [Francisella adeliensis]MBK2097065.1 Ppx/GppA family phosphatase [Francisella adeliensis]QIW11554.1 Ppx/GppA family phosphatase [Francisella adeliensis]QIW13428.1 Ppx/GppA family phosphatase [Francisella adeliensis]